MYRPVGSIRGSITGPDVGRARAPDPSSAQVQTAPDNANSGGPARLVDGVADDPGAGFPGSLPAGALRPARVPRPLSPSRASGSASTRSCPVATSNAQSRPVRDSPCAVRMNSTVLPSEVTEMLRGSPRVKRCVRACSRGKETGCAGSLTRPILPSGPMGTPSRAIGGFAASTCQPHASRGLDELVGTGRRSVRWARDSHTGGGSDGSIGQLVPHLPLDPEQHGAHAVEPERAHRLGQAEPVRQVVGYGEDGRGGQPVESFVQDAGEAAGGGCLRRGGEVQVHVGIRLSGGRSR